MALLSVSHVLLMEFKRNSCSHKVYEFCCRYFSNWLPEDLTATVNITISNRR